MVRMELIYLFCHYCQFHPLILSVQLLARVTRRYRDPNAKVSDSGLAGDNGNTGNVWRTVRARWDQVWRGEGREGGSGTRRRRKEGGVKSHLRLEQVRWVNWYIIFRSSLTAEQLSWHMLDIPFDEVRYPYCIDCVYETILWQIWYPCWIDSLYDFTCIVRTTYGYYI